MAEVQTPNDVTFHCQPLDNNPTEVTVRMDNPEQFNAVENVGGEGFFINEGNRRPIRFPATVVDREELIVRFQFMR